MKQQLTQPRPQLSLQGALEAKRILDQAVSEVRGYEGADLAASCLANIRRDAASSLRYELNKASPDLAALNVKYKF